MSKRRFFDLWFHMAPTTTTAVGTIVKDEKNNWIKFITWRKKYDFSIWEWSKLLPPGIGTISLYDGQLMTSRVFFEYVMDFFLYEN